MTSRLTAGAIGGPPQDLRPGDPSDRKPGLPRLAVKPDEAAEMLGVSRDYFDEHIKPELRIVRRGSKTIHLGRRAPALARQERDTVLTLRRC